MPGIKVVVQIMEASVPGKRQEMSEYKKILSKSKLRYFFITALWFLTLAVLKGSINLERENLLNHPWDLTGWLFIIIGIRSFYTHLFKFWDWYNGK